MHWAVIPIFFGERVTTRIFSLPLVFLIFLAGYYCQTWLDEQKRTPYLYGFLIIALGFLCSDLWNHFQLWEITSLTSLFEGGLHVFNPSTWVQVNYVDSLYTGILRRGLMISCGSFALAAVMAFFNPIEGFSLPIIQHLFLRSHNQLKHDK